MSLFATVPPTVLQRPNFIGDEEEGGEVVGTRE